MNNSVIISLDVHQFDTHTHTHRLPLIIRVYSITLIIRSERRCDSSNDWRSLFCSHSGPEPCENHYVVEIGTKGPLFKLRPSRSHLLIKLARSRARRRLSNVNVDKPILTLWHQSKTLSLWEFVRSRGPSSISPCRRERERKKEKSRKNKSDWAGAAFVWLEQWGRKKITLFRLSVL